MQDQASYIFDRGCPRFIPYGGFLTMNYSVA
jgi:hypothetical protein